MNCFLGSLIFLFAWVMVQSDPIQLNQFMQLQSEHSPGTKTTPSPDELDNIPLSKIVLKLLEIAEDEDRFYRELNEIPEQEREMMYNVLEKIKGDSLEPNNNVTTSQCFESCYNSCIADLACNEEDGYSLVNNRVCLKLYENGTDWHNSTARCEEDGGTLYSPDHPDFMQEISSFLGYPGRTRTPCSICSGGEGSFWADVWVGLKQNEGTHTYTFTSGKTITIDLGTGQDTSGEVDLPWYVYYSTGPYSSYWDGTDGPDIFHCFAYHHEPGFPIYGLHEYPCNLTIPFVCELPPY